MPDPDASFIIASDSPARTVAVGVAVAQHARGGDLIALIGELGAGKTQFVRGLAEGLRIPRRAVSSPTFVVVQEHVSDDADRPRLVHIDAYRLQRLEDLESIGWDVAGDLLGGEMRQGAVVAIEWADRLADLVGHDRLEVALTHQPGDRRGVHITAHGDWRPRLAGLQRDLEALAMNDPKPAGDGQKRDAKKRQTPCPICKHPVAADSPAFPFCSARCRTIDLGKWLREDYTISRPIEQSDLDE